MGKGMIAVDEKMTVEDEEEMNLEEKKEMIDMDGVEKVEEMSLVETGKDQDLKKKEMIGVHQKIDQAIQSRMEMNRTHPLTKSHLIHQQKKTRGLNLQKNHSLWE